MNELQPTATIPFDSIKIGERFRRDYGSIDELAASIASLGLIHPPAIDKHFNLVAGGRRMAAIKSLGWKDVPVTLAPGEGTGRELRMMELEENCRRKEMDWREKCQLVAEVHRLHVNESYLDKAKGEQTEVWTMNQTGSLMNMSQAMVSYTVEIARRLRDPQSPVHQAENMTHAIQLLLRKKQDEATTVLAKLRSIKTASIIDGNQQEVEVPLLDKDFFGEPEVTPPVPKVESVEAADARNKAYQEQQLARYREKAKSAKKIDVPLSQMLFHGDCLQVMKTFKDESVDGILTDPPYGIDMSMLEQQNQGMKNIDGVEATHDVLRNKALFVQMMPEFFRVLKEDSYCLLFCDTMQWQYLYDLAQEAGFRVQRWPLIWVKKHNCLNQAAQYNFTKATEFVMVLAKGSPTMVQPGTVNWFETDQTVQNLHKTVYPNHPFAKPGDLWTWLLRACFVRGQKVLDPFCGVGSSIHTMIRLGYVPVGIECHAPFFEELEHQTKKLYWRMFENDIVKFV